MVMPDEDRSHDQPSTESLDERYRAALRREADEWERIDAQLVARGIATGGWGRTYAAELRARAQRQRPDPDGAEPHTPSTSV